MDVVRITELQPKTYVEQGDYIAIDNQSDGTKKVQFTNLLDDTLSQENKIAPANVVGEEIATIRAAVGSPLKASTVAQMTDTNKIYVYVGSESGYTNGNWYYWNGSAWTSGGVYNSVAVVTDPTLTLSGVPADAKATGNKINDLNSGLYGGSRNFALSDEELTVGYVTSGGSPNSNSSYRYGFINISEATSATIHATGISNGSMIVNVCGANKAFKRNLYNWVSAGDYSILSFQTGDEYLCISCLATDVNKISVSAEIPKGVIDNIEDEISAIETNVETKMPLAKMYGGIINRELIDVVDGKYRTNDGTEVSSSSWCYGYVDISDADYVVVNQTGISDTTIINFVDKDKEWITNLGTWLVPNTYTYTAIPYTAKYICVSCKKVDKPIITYNIYPYAEVDAIEKNTDDSYRYDSSYGYVRTRHNDFIKGFHLDCGRKYFSVSNIKLMIDAMETAGLNALELYFSDDNGFRFGLNDMLITVGSKTYDLSVALGDGASPTDGSNKWLTESEMDELIAYANNKGIEVIPAFDMPSHMGAIRQDFPVNSISLRAEYGLGGEHGVNFMLAIIEKYATYFASKGSRYYNICCDETNTIPIEEIDMFMKRACKVITECHLTPMVFNDNVCIDGYFNPYINEGAFVLGWIKRSYQASYDMIENCGYRMINCASNNHFYWTLGVHTTDETLLNNIRNTNVFLMADEKIHREISGTMFCVWCDQADADGADDGNHVTSQVIPCILAYGEALAKYVPNKKAPSAEPLQTIDDLESMKNGGGLILKSANGTKYKLTITNNGAVEINAVL